MTVKKKHILDENGVTLLLVWTIDNSGTWYRTVFEVGTKRAKFVDRVMVRWKNGINAPRKVTESAKRRITDVVADVVRGEGYTPIIREKSTDTNSDGSERE